MNGEVCLAHQQEAACWCLMGAIKRVHGSLRDPAVYDRARKLCDHIRTKREQPTADHVSTDSIISYNDQESTTFADIKEALEVSGL
jgi:hypothetical protein